jgi:Cu(I)-responsive transcriptional regulator
MQTIGQAAKRTGLKIPTIRFYEQEGLLAPPRRAANGRRVYAEDDVRRLSFIRHSRALGFEMDDIRSLLKLADQPDRSCAAADTIARAHLATITARIAQLHRLRRELTRMVETCAGGTSADCRIIEALGDQELREARSAPAPVRAGKIRRNKKQ